MEKNLEQVNLEVDQRLLSLAGPLFETMEFEDEDFKQGMIFQLMRLAYLKGHEDATTSENPREFYEKLGYTGPKE